MGIWCVNKPHAPALISVPSCGRNGLELAFNLLEGAMRRRDFILKAVAIGISGLSISACTTSATTTTTPDTRGESGTKRRNAEIDVNVNATLARLQSTVPGARELVGKANGVLVFPSVIAAGLGIGGEYGEGALRVRNATSGYYSLASLTFGLQIGAQSKAIVFLLMTQEALDKFHRSEGWAVGADASVALAKIGANGVLEGASGLVVAFVMTNAGLMANLTLEGTKISRLKS